MLLSADRSAQRASRSCFSLWQADRRCGIIPEFPVVPFFLLAWLLSLFYEVIQYTIIILAVGPVLVSPSSVAFAAPVVPAVAVSAGGGSYAGVLGGAG